MTVKGLAWELGMAENSGTLFAKVAALRDFGLVEGRGELRVSDLARRILSPASPEDRREASIQAFQRVELLHTLYERFEGEAPDNDSLLVGLEEVTKAPRLEIIRRSNLIEKHLNDAVRVMKRASAQVEARTAPNGQQPGAATVMAADSVEAAADGNGGLCLIAGEVRLTAPLTLEYVDVAINLLRAMRASLEAKLGGKVTVPDE